MASKSFPVRAETPLLAANLIEFTRPTGSAKQATVRLRSGRFSITFGRVSERGTWKVKAAMVANSDYRGSSDATKFRVGR